MLDTVPPINKYTPNNKKKKKKKEKLIFLLNQTDQDFIISSVTIIFKTFNKSLPYFQFFLDKDQELKKNLFVTRYLMINSIGHK